jgi:lipopolysaccharide transport system ATP-binding protein
MSNIAIKVEGLGKLYRLGEIGTGTISHDLNRWFARMRGKEDPFAKIGETNDRTAKGNSDYVWSLKDIDFEVKKGEVLGIIGRNGAGKSTLLKILSKVTAPTTGNIKVNGRIASLLEVGTGFHPELTGRENIFLNGAILGMTKTEIHSKFDEIVDFSGVERYIDTPVKRYSSGMYVRLAFAVAAFLEPEILIVDEVLAVGDAEFQKKCLGRMKDVSVNDGRTVLFVSHSMPAVKTLCNRGLVLSNGGLQFAGDIIEAISIYSDYNSNKLTELNNQFKNISSNLTVYDVVINNNKTAPISLDSDILSIDIFGETSLPLQANIEVRLFSEERTLIAFYGPGHTDSILINIPEGKFSFYEKLLLPKNMPNGTYYFSVSISHPNIETYFELADIALIKESFQTVTGRALNYNQAGFFLLEKYAG